jgi:hypothetical protein
MNTPEEVSLHLVKGLRDATVKLDARRHKIDHEVLLLGVADMLAELIEITPADLKAEAMERVLHHIISHTGGMLVVVRKPPPTEH